MNEEKTPFVIAIAGVSGSGKSITAMTLQDKLSKSEIIYYDCCGIKSQKGTDNWMDDGGDCSQLDLAPFIKLLEKSYSTQLDYIVLDYPFAYKNLEVGKFIDLAIFIDTPLEVALKRRETRGLKISPDSVTDDCSTHENQIIHMDKMIENHFTNGEKVLKTIKPNSDVSIDGTQSVAMIVEEISKHIKLAL